MGSPAIALLVGCALLSGTIGLGIGLGVQRLSDGSPLGASGSPRVRPAPPTATDPPVPEAVDVDTLAARAIPAVVDITTTISGGIAAGTGMVISPSGQVLTNNHVIEGSTGVRVRIGGAGPARSAHVVGDDPADDIALLQIDGVSGIRTVTLGDSDHLTAGDAVVAIGNALGQGGTPAVTAGAITALDQSISAGDDLGSSETLRGLIQVDAPIQAGDSGGPLLDSSGSVIGMTTAADTGGRRRAASTTAFAIPINTARAIAAQIQSGHAGGNVQIGPAAFLGVGVVDAAAGNPDGSAAPVASGALVIRVQDGSPAGSAGITPGAVIVSLGGRGIGSAAQLSPATRSHRPGERVSVTWVSGTGGRHTATVQLASGPPA